MFKELLAKLRAAFGGAGLMHPKVTFTAAVAGIAALSDNQDDFTTLLGHTWGAKSYVISKWFGKFCIAFAAAGRSVLSEIDTPKAAPNA